MLKDQNECFQRLFTYPPIESGFTLVKSAFMIEDEIKKRRIAEEKAIVEKKEREEREKREKGEREKKEKEDKERERKEKEDREKREKEDREKQEKETDEVIKKQNLFSTTDTQQVKPSSSSTTKGAFFGNTSSSISTSTNTTTTNNKPQAPLFSSLDIMPPSTHTSQQSTTIKKEPTPFFSNIAKAVSKETQSINKANNPPKTSSDNQFATEQFFNKNFNQLTTKELFDKLQLLISKYKHQMDQNDALNIDIIVDALKVKMDNAK